MTNQRWYALRGVILLTLVALFVPARAAIAAFAPGTVAVAMTVSETAPIYRGAVLLVADSGTVMGELQPPGPQFNPTSVGFDPTGRLHVSLRRSSVAELDTEIYDSPTNAVLTVAAGGYAVAFDAQGNTYLSGSFGRIVKYAETGSVLRSFTVPHDRIESIDLASDQCTLWYVYTRFDNTGRIASHDVCQDASLTEVPITLAFFPSLSGERRALRILPGGDFLVTTIGGAQRISPSGTVVQTYAAGVAQPWVGLALDATGSQFWAGDPITLYRINVASGALLAGPIQLAAPGAVRAVTVWGEWRAATADAADIPTLSPLLILLFGISLTVVAWYQTN